MRRSRGKPLDCDYGASGIRTSRLDEHADRRRITVGLWDTSPLMNWAANIVVAGGAGFAVARWIIDLSLIPSLVIAVALTATSVGISGAVCDRRFAASDRFACVRFALLRGLR
ncbi:MAG: hypothetical protein ACLFP4_00255 [Spirochaetales bacterium]